MAKPGTFKPGQSGNPTGRPKIFNDVKELARQYTTEAVEALVAALKRPGEAVPAANSLLAYGYGRPQQTVNIRKIGNWEDLSEEELTALAQDKGEGREVIH